MISLPSLSIAQDFWNIPYEIFVKAPLYLVEGVGNAFGYLTGAKIMDSIFHAKGDAFGMPRTYVVFLAVASVLMILFGCLAVLKATMTSSVQSELSSLARRILMILVILAMIPIIFFCANFIVTQLILAIMPGSVDGKHLANQVGAMGFTSGSAPTGWHFWNAPDHTKYNLGIGAFGAMFSMVVFFILGVALLKRVFDIFLLYVVSPVVFSTAASSQRWSKVELWKDLCMARFVSSFGAVISLSLFTSLIPVLLKTGYSIGSDWPTHVAFGLIFICGGAIATLQSQTIFSSLVGATVGITDGLQMLTTASVAGKGVTAGAMGMLGVGKGVLFGSNRGRWNRNPNMGIGDDLGTTSLLRNPIQAVRERGVVRTATAATFGTMLATGGFLAGSAMSFKHRGFKETSKAGLKQTGKGIAKPFKATGKYAKTKTKHYAGVGLKPHQESQNIRRAKRVENKEIERKMKYEKQKLKDKNKLKNKE